MDTSHPMPFGTPSLSLKPLDPITLRKFALAPDEVETLRLQHNLSTKQLLVKLVKAGGAMARPPISGYHVG